MADAGNDLKLAFLGTGLMGGPMCSHLLAAGHPHAEWNRTRSKTDYLAAKGGKVIETADASALGADIIFLMLENGAAVAECFSVRASQPQWCQAPSWLI